MGRRDRLLSSEGQVALPPGIDEAGGGVDHQADAAEAALPLKAGHEVVGKLDVLKGAAQHELPGMQDEGVFVADFDDLGEVVEALLDVDVGAAGIGEDQNLAVEAEVDTGGLDVRRGRADQ